MDLVRLIQTEAVLWVQPIKVSQQALSQRLSSLPAGLFLEILENILPLMHTRWAERSERSRPLPPEVEWAQTQFSQVCICDGSTLDSLIRKLKVQVLRDLPKHPLAGRMTALLDLASRLPRHIWYTPDSSAHDQTFWEQIVSKIKTGALLVFDLGYGYINFAHFAELNTRQITFLTRAKSNLSYQVIRTLRTSAAVHDLIVWIGSDKDGTRPRQQVRLRLIEVLYQGLWYRYLTNALDDTRLPTDIAVALYWQRWRIEDAYAVVKRLLGLAYFWCADDNAIRLQLWATWMLYAVLVDLTDAVAEHLQRPFAAVSMEMVYRSLYYFTQAFHRDDDDAADPVVYLCNHAKLFGLIKRKPILSKLNLFPIADPDP